jgi:hypothetical protein
VLRPNALTWIKALQEAEQGLTTCPANPQHFHHQGLSSCPWCQLAKLQGRDPFPSRQEVEAGGGDGSAGAGEAVVTAVLAEEAAAGAAAPAGSPESTAARGLGSPPRSPVAKKEPAGPVPVAEVSHRVEPVPGQVRKKSARAVPVAQPARRSVFWPCVVGVVGMALVIGVLVLAIRVRDARNAKKGEPVPLTPNNINTDRKMP